jgi:hypothetical protein
LDAAGHRRAKKLALPDGSRDVQGVNRLFPALVFSFLLASSGLAANKFVEAGAPAPDRAWLGSDYQKMAELLSTGKLATPTLADPDGAAILRRMWSPENFKFYRNRLLPIGERLPSMQGVQSSVQALLEVYVKDANSGRKVSREIVETLAFGLRSSVVMLELVDEIVPTIPADRREQMDAALQQIRGELIRLFNVANVTLGERKVYSDADRSILLAAMAETLPAIKRVFPDEIVAEFRGRLEQRKTEFKDRADLRALDQMVQTLTPAAKAEPKRDGAKRTI